MSQDFEADAQELRDGLAASYGVLAAAFEDEDVFPFPYTVVLPTSETGDWFDLIELSDSVVNAVKAISSVPAEAVHPTMINVLTQMAMHWLAAAASYIAFNHVPSRATFGATQFCLLIMNKETTLWVAMAAGAIEMPKFGEEDSQQG